mmetsp:Transcript_47755/g.144429  ORF Transcript_47755/g.144429 Transcript_47755/m.144429 type:complete len:416 (+) Transcript_47755:1669-2916(+)
MVVIKPCVRHGNNLPISSNPFFPKGPLPLRPSAPSLHKALRLIVESVGLLLHLNRAHLGQRAQRKDETQHARHVRVVAVPLRRIAERNAHSHGISRLLRFGQHGVNPVNGRAAPDVGVDSGVEDLVPELDARGLIAQGRRLPAPGNQARNVVPAVGGFFVHECLNLVAEAAQVLDVHPGTHHNVERGIFAVDLIRAGEIALGHARLLRHVDDGESVLSDLTVRERRAVSAAPRIVTIRVRSFEHLVYDAAPHLGERVERQDVHVVQSDNYRHYAQAHIPDEARLVVVVVHGLERVNDVLIDEVQLDVHIELSQVDTDDLEDVLLPQSGGFVGDARTDQIPVENVAELDVVVVEQVIRLLPEGQIDVERYLLVPQPSGPFGPLLDPKVGVRVGIQYLGEPKDVDLLHLLLVDTRRQ